MGRAVMAGVDVRPTTSRSRRRPMVIWSKWTSFRSNYSVSKKLKPSSDHQSAWKPEFTTKKGGQKSRNKGYQPLYHCIIILPILNDTSSNYWIHFHWGYKHTVKVLNLGIFRFHNEPWTLNLFCIAVLSVIDSNTNIEYQAFPQWPWEKPHPR